MISPLSRLLEHSLASIDPRVNPDASPEAYDQRSTDIRGLRHPLKRHGAMAIHRLVAIAPQTAYRVQDCLLRGGGLERVGHGYEALVFRRGDEALKVYRRTTAMTDAEQAAFRDEHEHSVGVIEDGLRDFAIPHQFGIGAHPLIPDRPVVTARQRFVWFDSADSVFTKNGQAVDPGRLESIEMRHPGSLESLAAFACRSLDVYESTSYLPDTYGADNLVIGALRNRQPTVALIDAYPHKDYDGHDDIYSHIVSQLVDLSEAPARI